MVDKVRYPQIPSTVWWGVRYILQKTPNITVDDRLLGVQLGVQAAAAKAYVNELRSVGLFTEEGKATPLAQKWRLDETYQEAVNQIIADTYPEGLVHLAPPGDAERQKVVSWFLHEGLGQGAAGNKAATYLLISSQSPNDAPRADTKTSAESTPRARPSRTGSYSQKGENGGGVRTPQGMAGSPNPAARSGSEAFPLNVNVQIHISADAGTEQIESIFQAMRRYLYDAPTT